MEDREEELVSEKVQLNAKIRKEAQYWAELSSPISLDKAGVAIPRKDRNISMYKNNGNKL